jgi:ABC-type lipoprotein export system ATPase subunit
VNQSATLKMIITVFQKFHVLEAAKVKENIQTFILEGKVPTLDEEQQDCKDGL